MSSAKPSKSLIWEPAWKKKAESTLHQAPASVPTTVHVPSKRILSDSDDDSEGSSSSSPKKRRVDKFGRIITVKKTRLTQ